MSDEAGRPDEATVARLARQLALRASHVPGDDLRTRAAASFVAQLPPAVAVCVVGQLVREARDRRDAATAQAALGRALSRGLVEPDLVATWLGLARSRADRLAEAVFAAGPALREYDVDDEPFVDKQLARLSAGEKRALARSRDVDLIARLAHDQDVRVIRDLLANPRCTEREAVQVASRRPAKATVLEAVLQSRHGTSRRVRRAVAHNPYAPVALAVRALQGLSLPELDRVARDERLAGEVRRHAGSLATGRRSSARERSAPALRPADDPDLARLLSELGGEGDDEAELAFVDDDGRLRR